MIKLGFIVPTNVLKQYAVMSDYHLVLAHMVRDDPDYLQFYRDRSDNGDFITLDNSSYELGDDVFSEDELLEFAKAVGAREIMAPETYQDAESTMNKAKAFVDNIKSKNSDMQVFCTVHGSTYSEYLNVIDTYLELGVDTIGLSCRLDQEPKSRNRVHVGHSREWHSAMVRVRLVQDTVKMLGSSTNTNSVVHLLGLNHPCELAFQARFNFLVRSNDSSAAFLAGMEGRGVTDFFYEKPKAPINFYSGEEPGSTEHAQILKNISTMQFMAINKRICQ